MVYFDPELTEMIFFDLEFYVPKVDRDKPGASLLANPYKENHFLLGGVFHRHFPLKKNEDSKFEHHWVWREKNERTVLTSIYDFFQTSWRRLSNKDPKQADLIVTGVGISRFDIPILFIRSLVQGIAPPEELFECYFKLKQVDLTNVGIGFDRGVRVFYPMTANQLKNMFRIHKEDKVSGMKVWEMYDTNDRTGIETRCEEEVKEAILIYKEMHKKSFIK